MRLRPKIAILLAAVSLLFFFLTDLSNNIHHPIGSTDLTLFWIAGRLLLQGESPYNLELFSDALQALGLFMNPAAPLFVWNPPWVFTLLAPLALLPLNLVAKGWLLFTIFIFVHCFFLTLHLAEHKCGIKARVHKGWAILLVITYFPLLLCVWLGQLTPLVLLATCYWLKAEVAPEKNSRSNFISGSLLALTSIKPHLVFLLWAYAFAKFCRHKNVMFLGGMGTTLLLLNLLPATLRPEIYGEFLHTLERAPLYWQNPTLTSLIAREVQPDSLLIRFLPVAVASLGIFVLSLSHLNNRYAFLLFLIPLSVTVSPYGWTYDFIMFLPVLTISAVATPVVLSGFLLVNLGMFLVPSFTMGWYVWVPIATTLLSGLPLLSFDHSKS